MSRCNTGLSPQYKDLQVFSVEGLLVLSLHAHKSLHEKQATVSQLVVLRY